METKYLKINSKIFAVITVRFSFSAQKKYRFTKVFFFMLMCFFVQITFAQSKKQPVDYVNPFIGTKPSGEKASTDGRTHPGACVPFGMTKWIPVNKINSQSDPYIYVEDSARIRPNLDIVIKEEVFGFRGSHFPNGSHKPDYAHYDFMPMVGDLKFTPAERRTLQFW